MHTELLELLERRTGDIEIAYALYWKLKDEYPQINEQTRIVITPYHTLQIPRLEYAPQTFPVRFKAGGMIGLACRIVGGLLGWRRLINRGFGWHNPPAPGYIYTLVLQQFGVALFAPYPTQRRPKTTMISGGYDVLTDTLYVHESAELSRDAPQE